MKTYRLIKKIFLSATIVLFSYRAAFLIQQDSILLHDKHFFKAEADEYFLNHPQIFDELATNEYRILMKHAEQVHNEVAKYDAQLTHYLDLVTELVKNDCCNEKTVAKVERELSILEKAVAGIGIANLIDSTKIAEIKKNILYLRNLSQHKREKVNNIS